MSAFIIVHIHEASQHMEARRIAADIAARAGFSEIAAGKLAIAVTEAATNLVKHAGGGELLLRATQVNDVPVIEILVLDTGPGMHNVHQCMEDGYSTGGSPGTGMGAMIRQSSFFDIYSLPGKGTALFAQFFARALPESPATRHIELGGVATAMKGEGVCGDGWAAKQFVDSISVLITDGLGHGDSAAQASHEAARLFEERHSSNPTDMIKVIHEGLKSTRGAAAAIIEANATTGAVRYVGVGNTTGATIGPKGLRHMVSHNGTLGHRVQKIQEFSYDWPADSLLVFTTDGLQTQWNLDSYPGLMHRHPTLIAAVIYRDFNRGRDDATVVVAKRKAA